MVESSAIKHVCFVVAEKGLVVDSLQFAVPEWFAKLPPPRPMIGWEKPTMTYSVFLILAVCVVISGTRSSTWGLS